MKFTRLMAHLQFILQASRNTLPHPSLKKLRPVIMILTCHQVLKETIQDWLL